MSPAERFSAVPMLVLGAIFTGIIVMYAIERVNLWGRMPIEQYAVDFRRSLRQADPLQPILLVLTVIAAIVFALSSGGAAAVFAWLAVAQLAVIMVSSLTIAEPMNSKFRRLPEGEVPDGAVEIRVKWRRFHYLRTAFAVSAMICLALAATFT